MPTKNRNHFESQLDSEQNFLEECDKPKSKKAPKINSLQQQTKCET